MTPYDAHINEQKRTEQQSDASFQRYLDGSTDAGFGQLPRSKDTAYLMGWLDTIRRLPTDSNGEIIYYKPQQHFAYGIVDSPDPDCDYPF